MKTAIGLSVFIILLCASCVKNGQVGRTIDKMNPESDNFGFELNEPVESESDSSGFKLNETWTQVVYRMPDNIPIYEIPETVDFSEIGQMDYVAKVYYNSPDDASNYSPYYWREEAFIGGDISNIIDGHNIFEDINGFYKMEIEMPDGEYYGSDAKNTTNASLKRIFAERSVLMVSVDGEYVLCGTPDYSSGDYYYDLMCQLFSGEKIIDNGSQEDIIDRHDKLLYGTRLKSNDGSKVEIFDEKNIVARFTFNDYVSVKYCDYEKMIFAISAGGESMLRGYFCINYGETEAGFLFTAGHGDISPDGKYFITPSLNYYTSNDFEEQNGFYIRNIETGKTAFISAGKDVPMYLNIHSWVSKDGLNILYKERSKGTVLSLDNTSPL